MVWHHYESHQLRSSLIMAVDNHLELKKIGRIEILLLQVYYLLQELERAESYIHFLSCWSKGLSAQYYKIEIEIVSVLFSNY